mmetsp:Transcript_10561/g.27138  ORF Transcript_10561/g.27138 Transcript_10561/m.27138 type:complete len:437 (+) Transcript_10561:32-1342(+)
MWASTVAVAALSQALVTPDWSATFPNAKEFCVDPNGASPPGENARLVFVATPDETPPPTGWPVYFSFVTDIYPSATSQSCGESRTDKQALAFSAPADTLTHCGCIKNNSCPTRPTPPPTRSGAALDRRGKWPPWPPHHHGESCQYDTLAGELWDMRLKQFLVANGIAVVQINPSSDDGWVAYGTDPTGGVVWDTSTDKPFVTKVLSMLTAGNLGKLDADQVALRGWSGGAQMVSWMLQLDATGALPGEITIVAGMFLAGGSYDCYEPTPETSHSQCAQCDPSESCPGGAWHVNAGCSTNLTHAPCCSKCCPTNFTEGYYFTNPAAYAKHPPAFLSQLTTQDENADLCATRNYHETLLAHGVRSELVLTTPAYEKCYCIGDPADPAATGSPYSQYCTADMSWSCFTHEMGFAEMVVPSVEFLLSVFPNRTASGVRQA